MSGQIGKEKANEGDDDFEDEDDNGEESEEEEMDDSKNQKKKPTPFMGTSKQLEEDEILDYDNRAYEMLHRANTEWYTKIE